VAWLRSGSPRPSGVKEAVTGLCGERWHGPAVPGRPAVA